MPVHPGVYRVAGTPTTWEQRLHAACLAAGTDAAVSHRASLAWWAVDGGWRGAVEIAVPRPQWPRLDGVLKVHRSTDLHEGHVVIRHGIRITTPARALVDFGAVAHWTAVDRAYGHARGKRLVTGSAMERIVDELSRKGRRGVGVMRRVLENRAGMPDAVGYLAARGAAILDDFGISGAVAEYEIVGPHGWVATVDHAWPEMRFFVEWDGDERHGGNTAADVERQNALQELGWDFRRFGYAHVKQRREYVAHTIIRALAARHSLLVTNTSA